MFDANNEKKKEKKRETTEGIKLPDQERISIMWKRKLQIHEKRIPSNQQEMKEKKSNKRMLEKKKQVKFSKPNYSKNLIKK